MLTLTFTSEVDLVIAAVVVVVMVTQRKRIMILNENLRQEMRWVDKPRERWIYLFWKTVILMGKMVGHDEMGCGSGGSESPAGRLAGWLFGVWGGWMGRSKKKKGSLCVCLVS